MSLILDALRRAERARDKDLGRRVSESAPPAAPRRHRRVFWPLVIAGLLVFVLAVTLFRPGPPERAPVDEPMPPPVTAAPDPAPASPARGSSLAEIALPERPAALDEPVRSDAPLLGDLPRQVRLTVPTVEMNAHFWTADPTRRFVVIDMSRHREGDTMRNGLRVVAILPEGVELDWRGTRFRLLAH